MADAARYDDSEEFDTPHLPERYHQTVRAKKRERLKKHLVVGCAAVLVVILLYLLLSWAAGNLFLGILPQSPASANAGPKDIVPVAQTLAPPQNLTSVYALAFVQGAGLASPPPHGTIGLDSAVAALRNGYPEDDVQILAADRVDRYGRILYEFHVQPVLNGSPGFQVFIDAASGQFWSPGENAAAIPRDEAERLARAATVTDPAAERCLLTFTVSETGQKIWEYTLFWGSRHIARGSLDADTGEPLASARIIQPENRPANPVIDLARAQLIAERYIILHNGGQLPLNRSRSAYEPVVSAAGTVAGQYIFGYERTFLDFPTEVDGFSVAVDSVTGEVVGYARQWTTPEHAFSATTHPDIIRREATFAVMQKAKEIYPDDVGEIAIISAELRWMNKVPHGTISRPGTVPLAWKVVFDDAIIRRNASAPPAVAWVDAHSGGFITFDYRH
jgi:hypothetical protein